MQLVEAIRTRRTVRDFAERRVPDELVQRFIDMGSLAPAAGGHRPWRFVRVDDSEARRKIVDGFRVERTPDDVRALIDAWGVEDAALRAMYMEAIPRQASMIERAGALLIPCLLETGPLLAEKTSLHELNGFVSLWLCIATMLLAAAEEGVFGVTRILSTPAEAATVRSVLGIPDGVEIPCYLALGYPRESPSGRPHEGGDVHRRVCVNGWSSEA